MPGEPAAAPGQPAGVPGEPAAPPGQPAGVPGESAAPLGQAAAGPGSPLRRPGRVRGLMWSSLVNRAEHAAIAGEHAAIAGMERSVRIPAWRCRTRGEPRWPVTASIIVAAVLQRLLPDQLALRPLPPWLLPALEGGLLIGLTIANPVRIERRVTFVRWASLGLILLITAANAASAVLLIRQILTSQAGTTAGPLLASGAAIWATNVIAFALWYWEFDRGGPVHRAHATFQYLDFLFPQMTIDEMTPPDWEPRFVDYLYLSFTNATAFSPTDVMPLARWAKLTMLVQSAVSLGLGALVIARAVNIL